MSTPNHRSAPGTSYFVTTKCAQGRFVFQVAETVQILIDILLHYRDRGVYLLHGFVVMPDHLHVLLTPSPTLTLEKAMQLIKGGSSHRIHAARKMGMQIWQIGFHDWTVRDADDWHSKIEYIHNNPVRARLIQSAEDWPHSSAGGKFQLDPPPARYQQLSSVAKAVTTNPPASGLKPRPPEKHWATKSPTIQNGRTNS